MPPSSRSCGAPCRENRGNDRRSARGLVPGGVGADGTVLGWIEPLPGAVNPARTRIKRGFLQVLGAVLYRSSRPREAIARLGEAIGVGGGSVAPIEAVLLAMAHFRMGEPAKARALLSVPWRDEPDGPSAEDWWAWRGHRLLRREAARLILDPEFPTSPFSP